MYQYGWGTILFGFTHQWHPLSDKWAASLPNTWCIPLRSACLSLICLPVCQWCVNGHNKQSSGSWCHGVRYIYCWSKLKHTHTQCLFMLSEKGQRQDLLCVCPGLQKDLKEHQKAGDKKWERMQSRERESTVDSRLLTEAARRTGEL